MRKENWKMNKDNFFQFIFNINEGIIIGVIVHLIFSI